MPSSTDDDAPDDAPPETPTPDGRPTPGGPYFGRLLIVLLIAVLFCGFMTWLLSTVVTD